MRSENRQFWLGHLDIDKGKVACLMLDIKSNVRISVLKELNYET